MGKVSWLKETNKTFFALRTVLCEIGEEKKGRQRQCPVARRSFKPPTPTFNYKRTVAVCCPVYSPRPRFYNCAFDRTPCAFQRTLNSIRWRSWPVSILFLQCCELFLHHRSEPFPRNPNWMPTRLVLLLLPQSDSNNSRKASS